MDIEDLAQREIEEILKKYKLKIKYKFEFPIYRILPDEVKLALNVLSRNQMKILIEFESIKEKNK